MTFSCYLDCVSSARVIAFLGFAESKLDVANERLAHYEMIENDIDQAIIRAGSTNEAVTDDAQGKLTGESKGEGDVILI